MHDDREIANTIANDFGANATYVEDLLNQYQDNPKSVGGEWSAYFNRLLATNGAIVIEAQPVNGAAAQQAPAPKSEAPAPVAQPVQQVPAPVPAAAPASGDRMPIRGPALKIVENMEASLTVPTATSARQIQIKLLDENRRWINRHRESHGQSKTSYTHFIAWAMIKALQKYPQMNDGYEETDGVAYRVKRPDVNLGIAVDVQKKDGTRTLLVPNVKGANRMSFAGFIDAYQDVVLRARDGKLQVGDFQGTTISITNPGTIGTTSSTRG